jgi:sugar phosphate isomerase/epimerase
MKMLQHPFSRRHFLQVAAAVGGTMSLGGTFTFAAEDKPRYHYTCSSVNYVSLPLDEACSRIAALGYECIDIWDNVGKWLTCKHLEQAAALKPEGLTALLQKHKLKLGSITVYDLNYAQYAELLGQCGGGAAIQGSPNFKADSGNLAAEMKKYFETLKPAVELCEKYNSYLLIENHSGNSLLNKNDSLKAFTEHNVSDRIGIALAPYHILHNKESVTEAIKICGKQLRFLYLWSNEQDEKQMPGVGTVEMQDWLRTLKESGYDKLVTPFMHHEPAPDRMDELHRISLKYLRAF